jgi:hypothetical protein
MLLFRGIGMDSSLHAVWSYKEQSYIVNLLYKTKKRVKDGRRIGAIEVSQQLSV